MKFQRLLSILLTLQESGRKSTRALASQFEVSQRTIFRDVEALAEAGVPVYAERGRQGGVVLAEGYRRALTQLSSDDVRSLLAMGADPVADLGLKDRRARVSTQLLGALPLSERKKAVQAQQRVLVDHRRWYQGSQPFDVLRTLREATFQDRCTDIEYRDRTGNVSRRLIDPFGLVLKAGVWYLVARRAGEYRTYRVDRISSVVLLREQYERPADFDLEAYWSESTRRMEGPTLEYWITLRIARHVFEDVVATMEHEIVDRDGCVIRVNFGTASDAAWRVFGWNNDAEVLGPQDFIDELVRRSGSIVERYAIKGTRPRASIRPLGNEAR